MYIYVYKYICIYVYIYKNIDSSSPKPPERRSGMDGVEEPSDGVDSNDERMTILAEMYRYAFMYLYEYIYKCIAYDYTGRDVWVHMGNFCIFVLIYTYMCMYICIYIYLYKCIRRSIYIHINIHI
jgi:hypothetical protein